jgi:uncharacterized DUF497 family protein
MAEFEWDPVKEQRNIEKHDIDFSTASLIWQERVLEKIDDRRDYQEVRFRAWGEVEGRVVAVAFTWRGTARRIISARKANPRETRVFEKEVRDRSRPTPD